jgi:hypothetical protein
VLFLLYLHTSIPLLLASATQIDIRTTTMATSFKLEDIFSVKGKVWPPYIDLLPSLPFIPIQSRLRLQSILSSLYKPYDIRNWNTYTWCIAHLTDGRDYRRRIWIRKRCATLHSTQYINRFRHRLSRHK